VQSALSNQLTTCVEIINSYLQKIEEHNHLNAFVEVYTEEALNQALSVDSKLESGSAGKLAGMVIGIKDNLCYKGHKVSASSKILDGFESLFSATVIDRLLAEVKNPLDNTKVAGGSSGGSAAAVAAGLCLATLGSDTGGSIRQPAAFCGIVGLKPTYSRVSRYGLIAYASSFDQIGPLTNTVQDSALLLEVIAGEDEFDSTVSTRKVEQYTKAPLCDSPKRIAYIKECLDSKGLDPEIKQVIENKIEELKAEGHIVEPISFSYLDYLVPTYYVITTAEASSNLARFDGVHYGYRSENITNLESTYINSRSEGFGEEVKRRIMLGTFVLSAGYHDAYFTKAQKIRRLIQDKTNKMFKDYDFVISPTTPHTPFAIGTKHTDPTIMYLEDIFTVQANLAGNPAISIPIENHSNGMSIGLHIMADNFRESDLLAFSKYMNKEG
jgi:aspartyl-tRNA(Asn)/glutamyl-tRNA(Gln) amidotransferase subunit A